MEEDGPPLPIILWSAILPLRPFPHIIKKETAPAHSLPPLLCVLLASETVLNTKMEEDGPPLPIALLRGGVKERGRGGTPLSPLHPFPYRTKREIAHSLPPSQ